VGGIRSFPFADLLRQSVYSRLAGYEDLNDAQLDTSAHLSGMSAACPLGDNKLLQSYGTTLRYLFADLKRKVCASPRYPIPGEYRRIFHSETRNSKIETRGAPT